MSKEDGCDLITFPNLEMLEISICEFETHLLHWFDWQYVLRNGSLTRFIYTMSRYSQGMPKPLDFYRSKLDRLEAVIRSFSGLEEFALVLPHDIAADNEVDHLATMIVREGLFEQHSTTVEKISLIMEGGHSLESEALQALKARCPLLWNVENIQDDGAFTAWVADRYVPGFNRKWENEFTMAPGYPTDTMDEGSTD
jgi:hypothetical protein